MNSRGPDRVLEDCAKSLTHGHLNLYMECHTSHGVRKGGEVELRCL